jgi:CubicO group peptidase (beta-lactamase class C family)
VWPGGHGAAVERAARLIDELFTQPERYGTTYGALIVRSGCILAERYGGSLPHWDRPETPVEPDTPLLSWSMSKSILHAAIGVLVRDGRVDLTASAAVPAWRGDERAHITLEHLLTMTDGLAFREDYDDLGDSDVTTMLFGDAKGDVAGYAMGRPLAHRPGSTFNYSSGTSNIVARILGDVVGGGEAEVQEFLRREVFDPVGMSSATVGCDAAGTWVASSYCYATARDYARFGLLYARDGVWDGRRILPVGWVDHGRRARHTDTDGQTWHGAHWWSVRDDLSGFRAGGYAGQSILVVPGLDLVVVRLGQSESSQYGALTAWRKEVADAFRDS